MTMALTMQALGFINNQVVQYGTVVASKYVLIGDASSNQLFQYLRHSSVPPIRWQVT